MKHPDPKLHKLVSFIKSWTRILGYFMLLVNLKVAIPILVVSELVGIFEETV